MTREEMIKNAVADVVKPGGIPIAAVNVIKVVGDLMSSSSPRAGFRAGEGYVIRWYPDEGMVRVYHPQARECRAIPIFNVSDFPEPLPSPEARQRARELREAAEPAETAPETPKAKRGRGRRAPETIPAPPEDTAS